MEVAVSSMFNGAEGMINSMAENGSAIDPSQVESMLTDMLTTAGAGAVGFAVGFLVELLAISVVYLLSVISMWKIFKKAGEKGWASLIPIYSTYVLAKIAGLKPWIGIVAALAFIIPSVGTILSIVCLVFILYFVALSFGKSPAYVIGLVLLEPIFIMMLGFGKAEYKEPSAANVKIIGKDA